MNDKYLVTPVAMTQPLVSFIPDAEGLLSYQARVSNPNNQLNFDTADKLLAYCARENHWSVFEMVNVVLEIQAPRDISRQILRHKSNAFQEFSQRYADVSSSMFQLRELRLQDTSNRQNSLPLNNPDWDEEWKKDQLDVLDLVTTIAAKWKQRKAARECIRAIYPEGLTMSRMFVNFNIRSLVHYIKVRSGNGTQKEHTAIALKAMEVCAPLFPNSWDALMSGVTE